MLIILIEFLKEQGLNMIIKSIMPKKIQTIYTGCIPSYQMQKHLLVERFMVLIQSTYKPTWKNFATDLTEENSRVNGSAVSQLCVLRQKQLPILS